MGGELKEEWGFKLVVKEGDNKVVSGKTDTSCGEETRPLHPRVGKVSPAHPPRACGAENRNSG